MKTNVIATARSWNIENFRKLAQLEKDFKWVLITDKDELTRERLDRLDPEFVFFPHWSWIISENIYQNFNCVVFHMTDLPFGRGGHPLQNLISRGIQETKLTAIRVTGDIDAGPIYIKKPLSLSGSAEEIYRRASDITFSLISWIAREKPLPSEQQGQVVRFERRTPEMSEIPKAGDLEKVYDWIRMLDAQGYPHAFLDYGEFRLTFRKAKKANGIVTAEVVITIGNKDE